MHLLGFVILVLQGWLVLGDEATPICTPRTAPVWDFKYTLGKTNLRIYNDTDMVGLGNLSLIAGDTLQIQNNQLYVNRTVAVVPD